MERKPAYATDLMDRVEAERLEEARRAAKAHLLREEAEARVESERGVLQDVDDRIRALARGVPYVGGGMDEASAGLNTGFGWLGDYDRELAYQRARDADFDARRPVESSVLQTGGAVAGTVAGLRFLPKGPIRVPLPAGTKLLAGLGIGAGGGYAEGFTRGEGGFQSRNDEAKRSALWGAGFGAASPVVSKYVGAGYNAVASWLANRGIDAKSINILLDRLKEQGLTAEQAQARIAQMSDEAMFLDVTPRMQTFAARTALADEEAGSIIGQRLDRRIEGAVDRVQRTLDEVYGPPADPYKSGSSIRNQRAYEEGRTNVLKAGSDTMTPAQLEARIAQSSDPENTFRNQGVRDELERTMGNAWKNPGERVDRILDRDRNAQKVTSMMGPQKAQNLRLGLDSEATFIEAERARRNHAANYDAGRDFWQTNPKPGPVADMIGAGAAKTVVTGSLSKGFQTARDAAEDHLRQWIGGKLTRNPSPPALIHKTAQNLAAQGEDLTALARLLVVKAQELPKRSAAARTIEMIAKALLTPQAGRAGYEGQRLFYDGSR